MPSWSELISEFDALPEDHQERIRWLRTRPLEALKEVAEQRSGRNVIFYASAFLQKPESTGMSLQITYEEINGFMSVMYGMEWDKGLTLILHTPGGLPNATETIVDYLTAKFDDIEVIVPTYAMSAGTMISLASDRVVMGRQSQLGPIDPQMPIGGRTVSARAIVDQFDRAKSDISSDVQLAHVWAPVLTSLGPALLQEADNALGYSERMVAEWLSKRMFKDKDSPVAMGEETAAYFNDASTHKSHGRRINREEARSQNVVVEDLEADDELQDQVLTAYHALTIGFEKSPATKILLTDQDRMWVKNR